MIVPAAMNYYSAIDVLKRMGSKAREEHRKEMLTAMPDINDDTIRGIELGLTVARIILIGEPQIYQAGLKPGDLL